jgi:hypothetical protein
VVIAEDAGVFRDGVVRLLEDRGLPVSESDNRRVLAVLRYLNP